MNIYRSNKNGIGNPQRTPLDFPPIICTRTGCYQGMRELSIYQKFGTFTVTTEDAKEYLYSFSTRRRVYKFQDIKVNLYI